MRRLASILALAFGALLIASPAAAQYPVKPIKLLVPVPPGGPSDSAARTVVQALSKSIGQPVVVENRPGAGGALAAQSVLAASPDGYTLLWGLGSMVAIPMLQRSPPFQSLAEFMPVSTVMRVPFALYVHPRVPAGSLAEFVAYARSNRDQLSYATGPLSEFMAAAQFMKATGISMVRIPYKGGAQVLPDLIEGRVQVYFGPMSLALPHAKAGKVRMLAALAPERVALAPDVPTMKEAGYAQISVPTWNAIFGPPRMPRDIAERLSRETRRVLQAPEVRASFAQQPVPLEGSTPEQLAAAIAEDIETWKRFIRENDIPQE